jgi:hypothetical protein
MSPSWQLTLLQKIVDNLHKEPLKREPITESQLQALRLFRAKIGLAGIVGIRLEAADAVNQLADSIFGASQYQRGTTFAAIEDQLIELILLNYIDKAGEAAEAKDVAFVEQKIADWFREQIAVSEFFIPCFLSARPAAAFSVGPVRFAHIAEVTARSTKIEPQALFDQTFKNVFEQMQSVGASWIATIVIAGCTKDRAKEIANLAVDLALTSVQLCLPSRNVERMARMTGRTMPVVQHAVSRSNGTLSGGGSNKAPGLVFSPGFLEQSLALVEPVLTSVGRRVSAFVGNNYQLPRLEQSWCDAAYWFHEGLAEPLDTIAVPKLETALELLLHAESSKGSERRVLGAIRAFYGLESTEFINPDSQVTVKEFAKGFVTDRSRILHGTWSTLNHSLRASRPSLTTFVSDLLPRFSLALDQFTATASPLDDLDDLLNFVDSRRKAQPASDERRSENGVATDGP